MARRRLNWILIGVAAVGLAACAGGVLAWSWYNERPASVRGSSTLEFVPRAAPVGERRPERVVRDEPWTTYAYDAARTHLAFFPLRPPYRRIWMVRTGYYIEFPPAVAYGRVFVAQLKGRFFAIDAKTGRVIWQKRFSGCTAASPTVSNEVIYQPYVPRPCDYGSRSERGFIVALKVQGGRELWRFPISTESSLLLRRGVLYFGSWDHRVYALRVRDRKVLWMFDADDELNSSPVRERHDLCRLQRRQRLRARRDYRTPALACTVLCLETLGPGVLLRDADGRIWPRLHRQLGRNRLRVRRDHGSAAVGPPDRELRLLCRRDLAPDDLRRLL